ncbi:hypothetical protein D8674_008245 [Pyrus ussuriensis x Pyrus communis]|uniref:Uncharacterized protein n=1 Tax=Pyrus ussuriensis x Pyrus communis TaxID=2448454 RepID=A0A5N5HS85_9ROSA|nr:hypothetical protein D8674_008245 [Pyrus ussuriensis x Pyrus communis]
MGDSSASYIHLVQHLIEECIIFNMSKEECMEALSKHANIKPIITSTVWKELEKENKEFFEAYNKSREARSSEMVTEQKIQKMLFDLSQSGDNSTTADDGGDESDQ